MLFHIWRVTVFTDSVFTYYKARVRESLCYESKSPGKILKQAVMLPVVLGDKRVSTFSSPRQPPVLLHVWLLTLHFSTTLHIHKWICHLYSLSPPFPFSHSHIPIVIQSYTNLFLNFMYYFTILFIMYFILCSYFYFLVIFSTF